MGFRTNYPFDFCLLNSKEEDLFYLEDKVEGVTLKIANQLAAPMLLNTLGAKAGASNYHFALKFRPEVLNDNKKEQAFGEWKISEALIDAQGCSTIYLLYAGAAPLICESKGSIEIKFLVDINGSKGSRTTNVELLGKNITAGDVLFEDSVRQINWTLINHRGKSGLPLQLSFKDADTILNDGESRNSLRLRISNTNKSDADGDKAIEFTENSKIIFFFDPNLNSTAAALANADAIQRIIVKEDAPFDTHFNGAPPSGQEPLPVWTFTIADSAGLLLLPMINGSGAGLLTRQIPAQTKVSNVSTGVLTSKADICVNGRMVTEGELLFIIDDRRVYVPITGKFIKTIDKDKFAVGKIIEGGSQIGYIKSSLGVVNDKAAVTYIDFSFDNIITNYITGKTRLSVRLENIPGYWDETFVLHIDKQPMVFQNQNVGIGTNNPSQKLEIVVNNSGLNFPLLLHNLNGTAGNGNAVGLGFVNEAMGHWVKAAVVHERLGSYGTGSLKFLINSEENINPATLADARMTITSGGNVGIGTTNPDPSKRLEVNGDLQASKYFIKGSNLVYDNRGATIDWGSQIDGNLYFRSLQNQGNSDGGHRDLVVITSGGRMGINNIEPQQTLDVVGSIGIRNTAAWDHMMIHHDGTTGFISAGGAENGLALRVGNTNSGSYGQQSYPEIMRLLPDGNVGIGTPDPRKKLQVEGDVQAGNYYIKSTHLVYDSYDAVIDWGNRSTGNLYFRTLSNQGDPNGYKDLAIITSDANLLVNGKIGIGKHDPEFPIDINSWNNISMQKGFWFLMDGACRASVGTHTNSVSIRASTGIYCAAYYCFSDERIKEEITTADGRDALGLLNKLVVKNYYYKDYVSQGPGIKKGFIAQEVEQIIPEAVSITKDFTPGIYSLAENATLADGLLTISLKKAHELSTGDRVRIITEASGVQDVQVNVLDELTFTVQDWTFSAEHLFIYGEEVDDFRTLDYDYVFCTGISAIQELSKQVDALTQQLQHQEARLQRLEALLNKSEE
ncbi:hypothetical protein GCM10028824_12840 [Hymenobacter segetis]|uniref:Tail fiber domain-containing protein n=1 Tax=Hymenobacter segetis TaxID=2025509 RepID=A0ABU9LX19_9BACT